MTYILAYAGIALIYYIFLVSFLYGKVPSINNPVWFLMLMSIMWPLSILLHLIDLVLFIVDKLGGDS